MRLKSRRSTRLSRAAAILVFAAVIIGVLKSAGEAKDAPQPRIVEANTIHVEKLIVQSRKPGKGKILISAQEGDDPSVSFFDGDDRLRCVLTDREITFYNKEAKVVVHLARESGGGHLRIGPPVQKNDEVGSIDLYANEQWGNASILIRRLGPNGHFSELCLKIDDSGPAVLGTPEVKLRNGR